MTTGAELRRYLLAELDGFARSAGGIRGMVERKDASGIRIVAELLQQRDLARSLAAWITDLLRDEAFPAGTTRVLEGLKVLLVRLEVGAGMAIALGGTGHTDEAWWARRAGEAHEALLGTRADIEALAD